MGIIYSNMLFPRHWTASMARGLLVLGSNLKRGDNDKHASATFVDFAVFVQRREQTSLGHIFLWALFLCALKFSIQHCG